VIPPNARRRKRCCAVPFASPTRTTTFSTRSYTPRSEARLSSRFFLAHVRPCLRPCSKKLRQRHVHGRSNVQGRSMPRLSCNSLACSLLLGRDRPLVVRSVIRLRGRRRRKLGGLCHHPCEPFSLVIFTLSSSFPTHVVVTSDVSRLGFGFLIPIYGFVVSLVLFELSEDWTLSLGAIWSAEEFLMGSLFVSLFPGVYRYDTPIKSCCWFFPHPFFKQYSMGG